MPGEIIALVGPSGEGKTTMIRLILGLIRPEEGNVILKAADGSGVEMNADTRHLFAYVPQGNTILSGTIAENMRMVKEHAADEEIIDALKAACAWDFIEKLNGEYAPDADTRPSRLIITTDAEEFEDSFFKYLEDKGYVVEGDSSHVQLQSFVYGILFVIIAVGFLFSLLAFFLLVVSIMLLLEKNKEKIVNLFSLGYSIRRISRVYQLTVLVIDAFVWILAASVTTILYPRFATMMQDASPEFVPATLWQIWGLALILIILFSLLHGVVVYRQVRKHCKIK
jgi:energy-coupling factor transporter ATP-binding protein EcfA2